MRGIAVSIRAPAIRPRCPPERAHFYPSRPPALRGHSVTLIWSAGCQPGRGESPRCLRGVGVGGESASAVVDVCVATHMRGSVPHDRVCEIEERCRSLASSMATRAAPSVLSGRSSRRCAGALSSPSRWWWLLLDRRERPTVARVLQAGRLRSNSIARQPIRVRAKIVWSDRDRDHHPERGRKVEDAARRTRGPT